MSLRHSSMPLAVAVLALSASIAPATTAAQAPARLFVAELAAPAAEARVVAGGMVWRCVETRCTASLNGTRPLRVCRDLQRAVGPVVRFEADGTALAEGDLARCNG